MVNDAFNAFNRFHLTAETPDMALDEQLIGDTNREFIELQRLGGFSRWQVNLNTEVITLDQSTMELLGIADKHDGGGITIIEMLKEIEVEDPSYVRGMFLAPIQKPQDGKSQFRFWNRSKSIWQAARVSGWRTEGGPATAPLTSGFIMDVSELFEAQQMLSRERRLLETTEHIGKMGHWALKWHENLADGSYECSGSISTVLGFGSTQTFITVQDFRSRIHPEDITRCDATFQNALRHADHAEVEYRFRNIAEQRWMTVRSFSYFVRDPARRVIAIQGCTQDITARKADETALLHDRLMLESAEQLARLGTWTIDLRTDAMQISVHLSNILGMPAELGRNGTFSDLLLLIHPDDRAKMEQSRMESVRTHEPLTLVYRHWHIRAKRWITVKSTGRIVLNDGGTPIEMHGVTGDISEQKESQERLRLSASVFQYSRSMIVISNAAHEVVQVNRAFSEIYGYSAASIVGAKQDFQNIVFPDGISEETIWGLVDELGLWQGEAVGHNNHGRQIPMMLNIIAVRNDAGIIEHYITIGDDITEQKIAEETNRRFAFYDTLTDLPNRVLLRDRVNQAISNAKREGVECALLFLDLDNFKHVNDSLGHFVGDSLLKETAARIQAALRASDSVGRLGGDEFLVLLPHGGMHAAELVANKIVRAVQQPCLVEGNSLTVSVSIGISLYPNDANNFDDLMRTADTAMYRAKDSGRNGYLFFTQEMNQAVQARLTLTNDLRAAISRNELMIHYQPQLSIAGGALIGYEALLRWNHPARGAISPAQFIPLAEESGLIESIGNWVMKEACSQIQRWIEAGSPVLSIAINCSVRQLQSAESLLQGVRVALDVSGLDPQLIELEITESVLAKHPEQILAVLEKIRALGVRISIDDFGTGYSSLSYLKKMPIDKLKIDRSFVSDIHENEHDRAIAETIIALGHTLNLKIVAEGIENKQQLDALASMSCDQGQGFYWKRPMCAVDCLAWMTSHALMSNARLDIGFQSDAQ